MWLAAVVAVAAAAAGAGVGGGGGGPEETPGTLGEEGKSGEGTGTELGCRGLCFHGRGDCGARLTEAGFKRAAPRRWGWRWGNWLAIASPQRARGQGRGWFYAEALLLG